LYAKPPDSMRDIVCPYRLGAARRCLSPVHVEPDWDTTRGQEGQRPVQRGLRLSMNARTPSRKSALPEVQAMRSSPAGGRRCSWIRRIASLVALSVIGA